MVTVFTISKIILNIAIKILFKRLHGVWQIKFSVVKLSQYDHCSRRAFMWEIVISCTARLLHTHSLPTRHCLWCVKEG